MSDRFIARVERAERLAAGEGRSGLSCRSRSRIATTTGPRRRSGERHRRSSRPADPRLARQPDRRGRRRARVRCARARGGSLGRLDRRSRGCRAARRRRQAYGGKGVLQAVANVEGEIAAGRPGLDAGDQEAIDRRLIELDGTPNKGRLGANAILGVSLAPPRPRPSRRVSALFRYLGGAEARTPARADAERASTAERTPQNSIDLQEFMVVPGRRRSFREALRCGVRDVPCPAACCTSAGFAPAVGDEGGFAPDLDSSERGDRGRPRGDRAGGYARPESRSRSTPPPPSSGTTASYRFEGRELDAARRWSASSLTSSRRIRIVSIEDRLAEDDWDGWAS